MIRLKVDCRDGEHLKHDWIRKIQINEELNCAEFHCWLVGEIGFYKDQPFEFYYGDKYGRRKETVTEPEQPYSKFYGREKWEKITISELFPIPKRNRWLFYNYDCSASWIFLLKKLGKTKPSENLKISPTILESIGKNPAQYIFD